MKITRVEPFHVSWGSGRGRSAWVRIWTDTGLFGLGEASPMVHGNASLTHSHHPAEYNGPREIQDVVFKTPVRPTRGKFVLSDAPGLGLELDEDELKKRVVPWESSAAR